MTFHIGQKVVCINDVFRDPRWSMFTDLGVVRPQRGKIYRIRAIYPDCIFADGSSFAAFLLEELVNPEFLGMQPAEPVWAAYRFRPLVERKSETDISWAIDILDRVSKDARSKEPV
jgi:hypothetical protein